MLERVTERVVDELRRRLGGPFTIDELVELYDHGTGWVTDVAVAAAPENPEAWDVRTSATRPSRATCARRPTSRAGGGSSASAEGCAAPLGRGWLPGRQLNDG